MSPQKSLFKSFIKFAGAMALIGTAACGVKDDPIPPEKESPLGRGRPDYKGALKSFKVPEGTVPIYVDEDDEEDDEEDENGKGDE